MGRHLAAHDIVTIGASAGGVEALRDLTAGLPADLPAAVFVVVHLPGGHPSALPRILNRAGPLEATHPEDGDAIRPGRVYLAPPDLHLLVEEGRVRLARGPKENLHRPAVDPLFRTAALAYGPRVVGVVLTGARDDGASGLRAIKGRGGLAVVQDPEDALFSGMPESALRYAEVDHRVSLEKMAPLLDRLCREPAGERGAYPVPDGLEFESKMAGLDHSVVDGGGRIGELSGFTCPDCSGPLYEIRDGELVRFRCRVGHAYTADTMMDEKTEVLENALYVALSTLEESAAVSDRLAARSRHDGHVHAAERFEERSRDTRRRAATIRRVITEEQPAAAVEAG